MGSLSVFRSRGLGASLAIVSFVALTACTGSSELEVDDAPEAAAAPQGGEGPASPPEASTESSATAMLLEGTPWKYEVVGWRPVAAPEGRAVALATGTEAFFYTPDGCETPGLEVSIAYGELDATTGEVLGGGGYQGNCWGEGGGEFMCYEREMPPIDWVKTQIGPEQLACFLDGSIVIVGPLDGSGAFETVEFGLTWFPSMFQDGSSTLEYSGDGSWSSLEPYGYTATETDRVVTISAEEVRLTVPWFVLYTDSTRPELEAVFGLLVDLRLTPA